MLTLALAAPAIAAPSAVSLGQMESYGQPGGLWFAAPHGGFDLYTDDMARQAALTMGAGYLIATGYRTHERPWNVNRPTQGVGLAMNRETTSDGAREVYTAYDARVREAAPDLYVELHGNSRLASSGAIEAATQGILPEDMRWFKHDMLKRIDTLGPEVPHLGLLVDLLDGVHYSAEAVKHVGVFTHVKRALQLELPASIRKDERARSHYAWVIGESVEALYQHMVQEDAEE